MLFIDQSSLEYLVTTVATMYIIETDLVFRLCQGSLVAAATGPAHELWAVVPPVEGRLLLALVTRLGGTVALGGGVRLGMEKG